MSDLTRLSQRMLGLSSRIVPYANEVVRAVGEEFLTTVVNETPVDEGDAVSSWKVGLNYTPVGERDAFTRGKKGSTAASNRNAVLSKELPKIRKRVTGQTISIVNTSPYIEMLENGSSKQAPAGFIARARVRMLAAGRAVRFKR